MAIHCLMCDSSDLKYIPQWNNMKNQIVCGDDGNDLNPKVSMVWLWYWGHVITVIALTAAF